MTSRRKFLTQGTLGAIAAGFTLGLGDKVIGREVLASSTTTLGLNRAAFASQLQTTFLINDGTRKIPLKLVEVVDRGKTTGQREAFALVLRGTNFSPLNQETYAIEHEKLGRFSLLVVPILAQDKKARYYEININRLHG
jgi:hypothetical protein